MTRNHNSSDALMLAGPNCFEGEHQWPASLTDPYEIEDAVDGIGDDFGRVFAHRHNLAPRLIEVLEAVAAGNCLGCKNVACRIQMLIEDLEAEVAGA